jgi:hypothetical protein
MCWLILASRIAVAGGVLVLGGMLFGAIHFDLGIMAAAVAALLGGIVVWGSNRRSLKAICWDGCHDWELSGRLDPGLSGAKG